MKEGTNVICTLIDIYWLDEYNAIIYTDKGEINLEDAKYILKLGVA